MLLRAEGLPAGAFLGQYLEELYAGWRWLERDNTTTGAHNPFASAFYCCQPAGKSITCHLGLPSCLTIPLSSPRLLTCPAAVVAALAVAFPAFCPCAGRGFGRAPLACGWAHRPSFTMRWWSGRPVMRAVMMCSL